MTYGSRIHDELGRHFGSCEQCRLTNPEHERVARPGRGDVSDTTWRAMCPDGRSIYRAYLQWLADK